jgi:hypothetical protein
MDMRGMITPWLESTEMKGHYQRPTLPIPVQICASRRRLLKLCNQREAEVLPLLRMGHGGKTYHREQGE